MTAPTADNLRAAPCAGDGAVAVLTKVLRITRIAMVFVLVTVIGTAARVPFFPLRFGGDPADPEARWPTVFIGAAVDPDMTAAAIYTQSAVDIIMIAAGVFIITEMLQVLRNVAAGNAFVRENGQRLRRMGYAGVIAQLSVYAVWIAAEAIAVAGIADVEGLIIEISPAPWIVILCAFALSTVFNDAATLKEEQDLTV